MDKRVAPEKARQGKLGHPVLIVLIVALILAAIAWFGSEMFGQAIDPQNDEAPTTTQTEPMGDSTSNP